MDTARGTYAGTLTIEVAGVPYPLEFGDWVDDRLWSTCQFGATQSTALQTLVGAPGDLKPGGTVSLTIRESNLPRGGGSGLPDGYEMLAFSIQHIIPTNFADAYPFAAMIDIFTKTKFTFKVQNKAKQEAPVYKHPAGSGPYNPFVSQGTNNGVPSPRDQAAFVLPIEIRPNVAFNGLFEFDAALAITTAIDVETHLQGLYKRPVT